MLSNYISTFIFKFGLPLICLSGLLYQLRELFDEYMSGKTVVAIKVGKFDTETIPAFTICLPYYISVDKVMRKENDTFSELARTYSKRVMELNESALQGLIMDEKTKSKLMKVLFYYNKLQNAIMDSKIHPGQILRNYSIPMKR